MGGGEIGQGLNYSLSIILSPRYNSIESSMTPFTLQPQVFLLLAALLLTPTWQYHSNSCFLGCQACEIFSFYMYCTQCLPQRYLDPVSGLCPCTPGTYDTGGNCAECPNYCLTCTQYACTSCSADKYYHNGNCVCKNGYGIDAAGNCDGTLIPSNIGLILGISFGVAAGLVCFVTLIVMVRKRSFRLFQQDSHNHHPHLSTPNTLTLEVRPESDDSSALGTILETRLDKKYSFRSEICSICLQESPLCMTECSHYFHERCIGEWMRKRQNCPNCNHTISRKRLLKWCGSCKKELIRPQSSQIYRIGRNYSPPREDLPIFWPICSRCQGSEELSVK